MRAVFVLVREHLCASEDTFKADTCFEHVGERLSGTSFVVCLCVRARERGREIEIGRVRRKRGRRVDDISSLHHGSST